MNLLSKVLIIVRKDLAAELRAKEKFSSMFVFSLLVIAVFSFSFDLRVEKALAVAPGVLWSTIAFASTLELNRALSSEMEGGCLDGLLLAPVERGAIYLGKMIGNLIFMSGIEALILPIFSAVFNLNLVQMPLLLITFLGTVGFAAVGTLLSVIAVNSRAQEVLLPVLLFPIILPVVISAVKSTSGILDGLPFSDIAHWLRLLIGFDIIFLVVSYLTFDYVVEN